MTPSTSSIAKDAAPSVAAPIERGSAMTANFGIVDIVNKYVYSKKISMSMVN